MRASGILSPMIFSEGDTANTTIAIMDSYTLKHSNIIDEPALYKQLLAGKGGNPETDKNAFVYQLLSNAGKDAVARLVKKPDDGRDRELFLLELNRSVVDKDISWPQILLKDALKNPLLVKAGKRNYNLVVLSTLYPGIIRETFAPRFQWTYDLAATLAELPKVAMAYFTINVPTRYSPLVNIYGTEVQIYVQNNPGHLLAAMLLMGLIYASLMAVVFLIAVKFTRSIAWALCAVFLFQASVSTLLISNQLFSLPYLFVPLVMAGAILAYLQYKERGNVWWLAVFIFLSIIGPWFREFPGATPFIVFASELLSYRGKRSRILLLVCVPLMFHSVYPTLLPWIIGLNKGGVYSVFSQGNVQQVSGTTALNLYFNGMLFVQFPPTLWILVLISIGYWVWRTTAAPLEASPDAGFAKRVLLSIARSVPSAVARYGFILMLIIVACGFAYSFFIASKGLEHFTALRPIHGMWMLLLVSLVTFMSFRFGVLLPVYFAATFLPFLRLQLAELHLSFALVPISILMTLWIQDMFHHMRANLKAGERPSLAVVLASVLLVIGLTDQFLNIPACVAVQKRMVGANKEMAAWLVNNAPRHSIVVMNFYNFTDVFYYSNYYIDPYETVENCPMGPTKVVHWNKDFASLIDRNLGIRDVYLLAAEHEFRWKDAEAYHSHKYVRTPPGHMEKLAVFPARTIYYYADPFKYFVPRFFVSFLGYMDWSNDFYYDNTKSPFKRIVYADYVLYKLKDLSKGFPPENVPLPGETPPQLVGSYRGYNIVDYGKQFYGVAQSMGPLDLSRKEDRSRAGIVVSKNRNEIEQLIDKAIQSPRADNGANYAPQLVGSYRGYNIVDYGNQFYGVAQSMGPLDLSRKEDRSRAGIVVSKDRKEVEQLIDRAIQEGKK